VEYDGKKVGTEDQFRRYVAETTPGKKIRLRVLRDQESLEILTELMERDLAEAKTPEIAPQKKESDRVGWRIENMQTSHPVLQPDHETGVVVQHIQSGRAADTAGLRTGDIILEANKKPVADAAGLEKIVADAKKGEIFLLYVYRFGSYVFVTLQVP
jgi:serine protease Do